MTDPASPAAVTDAEKRLKIYPTRAERDACRAKGVTQALSMAFDNIDALEDVLDARGLELADTKNHLAGVVDQLAEANDLAIQHERRGNIAQTDLNFALNRADAAEARLAQANEALADAYERAAKEVESFMPSMEKSSTKTVLKIVADAIRALTEPRMGTGEKMKLDEMEATWRAAWAKQCGIQSEYSGEPTRAALRAVLETHVKPMLAEAFKEGGVHAFGALHKLRNDFKDADDYASHVIASLTQEPARDV